MSGKNAPDPTEHFLLAEGEQKVIYTPDSKIVNTGTFTLNKEDHTMGNILRCQLLRDPRILFAGYRMPHPLINHTLLRVRAVNGIDPRVVTADAADTLVLELDSLQQQFEEQMNRGLHGGGGGNANSSYMD